MMFGETDPSEQRGGEASGPAVVPGKVTFSRRELDRIEYTPKERDIVLNHTGAGAYNTEERYRTDHPGMSAGATRWLISQGVRLMGCDAARNTAGKTDE